MKMKKIIKSTLALFFTTVALTSCLKDDSMVLDPEKAGSNVLEFVNPTDIAVHGSTTAAYTLAYPIVTTNTTIPISVSYSGAEDSAPSDITVGVGLGDLAVITQYNTEQTKTFEMMPTDVYTINATSVVIPKGQKTATFTVSIKTSLFDLSKSYALPLKITSTTAGIISKNFSNIILNIAAKNAYDGLYKPTAGTFQRYSNPTTPTVNDALNGFMGFNANMTLSTANATAVNVAGLRWGSSVPNTGSSSGVAGIDGLTFTVDPATNNVTVKSAGNASLANIPGEVNKYDPATKTFTLSFDWNQTANKREVKGLVLKYAGVRP